ncbi:MAG: MCE family protein [Kiritimatiellae bacterium]|nr:MCE family protein [Kiritimatiellia bacterium]
MKQNRRYFLTGLFVLTGFLLFAIGCVLFGGSELFADKLYFETYFATSVQGLDGGGAVKFRGVPVGKVEEIAFVGDVYAADLMALPDLSAEQYHQMMAYIRVRCSIDRRQFPSYTPERLKEMVQQGLRTSLGMQGITGIVFINLDYGEEALLAERDLKVVWEPDDLYVPSMPTVLQTIVDVAADLCEKLGKIDFPKTMESLTELVTHVDSAVTGADLPRLSATFTTLGESLNQQTAALSKVVDALDAETLGANIRQLTENVTATSQSVRDALPRLTHQADATMTAVQEMLGSLKVTLGEVNLTVLQLRQSVDIAAMGSETDDALSALSRTAASLEALIDEIREKPSRLIFDSPVEE